MSIGNKADVNEVDLLRYLRDDPDTKVILMYLEDITDGHAFIEVARDITLTGGKPILALKVGPVARKGPGPQPPTPAPWPVPIPPTTPSSCRAESRAWRA